MEPKVLTELKDGVLIVTINRPEKRNAIDSETAQMLEKTFNDAEKDSSVRCIVFTGAGDKSFSAGEDLSAYDENGTCMTIMDHGFAGITDRVSSKPYICAANGSCIGGGLEMALQCDIIVAADHAKLGLSEVKLGFIASSGGIVKLPNCIPRKIANEMILTGQLIDTKRALELGLINYAVPADQVMDKAMEIARIIAKNAPISLKLSKKLIHVSTQNTMEDAQRLSDVMWDYIELTEDAVEGPKAFLEKREPNWKGR